jgi:hypothetical protein
MPDWSKMDLIPRNGLEAWYQVDPSTSTSILAPDFSGKDRHLTVGAGNSPVLGTSPLNNELGYLFNGARDPLAWSGTVNVKQVFTIIGFNKPTFTQYEGVISGLTVGNILTSDNTGTKFFPFGTTGYEYRKADVLYAPGNMQAPVNGSFALIEQIVPGAGFTLDGIQIGKQLTEASRLLDGWWMGALFYSTLQNEIPKLKILMYHAMRFHLWPMVSSGLNVFPFPANKTRAQELDVEHYVSQPYEGDEKVLVREEMDRYQWSFSTRIQEERDAAAAFYSQHRPIEPFVMRDYRFIPPRDINSKLASSFREQGSDVSWRFNYSFETEKV